MVAVRVLALAPARSTKLFDTKHKARNIWKRPSSKQVYFEVLQPQDEFLSGQPLQAPSGHPKGP